MTISKHDRATARFLGTAALIMALMDSITFAARAQTTHDVHVGSGMVLRLRLDSKLSTDKLKHGEGFSATLQTRDLSLTYEGLPNGSRVEGVVKTAHPENGGASGVLEFSFHNRRQPKGTAYSIKGTLLGQTPNGAALKPGTEIGVRVDQLDKSVSPPDATYRVHEESGDVSPTRRSDSGVHREGIGVMYGDQNIAFDPSAPPFMQRNSVMIPAIPVLQSAGVEATYDAKRGMLIAHGDAGTVTMFADSVIARVAGDRRVRAEAPARMVHGVFYAPAKFLALATGMVAQYDAHTQTVVLLSRQEALDQRERAR